MICLKITKRSGKCHSFIIMYKTLSRVPNFFNRNRICTDLDFSQLTEIHAIRVTTRNVGAVGLCFRNLYTALSDEIFMILIRQMFN